MCEELHGKKYLGGERCIGEKPWTTFDEVDRDGIDYFSRTTKNSIGQSFLQLISGLFRLGRGVLFRKPVSCHIIFYVGGETEKGCEKKHSNVLMQVYAVMINSVRKAQIVMWIQGKETFSLVKNIKVFLGDEEFEWH